MLPNGFEEKMQALLGPEYEAFLQALDGPRHVGLRRNPRKPLEPQDLDFGLSPVPWEPLGHTYDPSCRPGLDPRHEAGGFYLQEPSAMAPVALLDPQPGERILDLCAAPGGKSTQIAGRLMGSGLLVCNEIHPKRAKILSSNLERLGIENALVLNEHPQSLAARFAGFFDRVLVDAPCSGEGMFRKHDEAVTDWSAETVAMCARRQQEILQSAACMLRPGGRLVYSTCTFSPEEDEGTVALFLERHPDFFVEPQDTPWFAPGRPEWVPGGRAELAGTVRLWPHKLAGEGHFAAVLRRRGDEPAAGVNTLSAQKLPAAAETLLRELGVTLPDGIPVAFGDTWYLAPPDTPVLSGLRVLRPGLELGTVQKGRFLPSHALALWCSACTAELALDPAGDEIRRYLAGQTLACNQTGWVLVKTGGLSIGWGKASGGVLKNHYPKGLRRPYAPASHG